MAKIISIHSYRGGTGKSNLTANFVTAMALQGNRVGVVDADIQSPGIHHIFGINQTEITSTLNNYLWGQNSISEATYNITNKIGVTSEGKVFFVPSSTNPDHISRILSEGYNAYLLNKAFEELIHIFDLDYLFIDTHPGLNREIFLSIVVSDILFLVLRPDQQDFEGTAITIDVAKQLKARNINLLVNKVIRNIDFDLIKKQIENTYSIPVASLFPVSEEMILLGSNGIFCLEYPQHDWTNSLMNAVNILTSSPP